MYIVGYLSLSLSPPTPRITKSERVGHGRISVVSKVTSNQQGYLMGKHLLTIPRWQREGLGRRVDVRRRASNRDFVKVTVQTQIIVHNRYCTPISCQIFQLWNNTEYSMDGIIEATQISVSTIIVTYTSSKNVKIRSGWLIWKNCTICRDTRYSDIFTIRKISRVRHKLGSTSFWNEIPKIRYTRQGACIGIILSELLPGHFQATTYTLSQLNKCAQVCDSAGCIEKAIAF